MYTAMILACFAGQDCLEFTDIRGPYNTVKECEVRVEEMVKGITEIFPFPVTNLQYKCEPDNNKIGA